MKDGNECKDKEEGAEVEPKVKGTYCPWCVGVEEGLRLQKQGLTSKICPKHARQLMEEVRDLNK